MKKLLSFMLILTSLFLNAQKNNYRFLIGTFTANTPSEGIYTLDINTKNKTHSIKFIEKGISNPSFLAISPDSNFVYTVSESGVSSTINAFKFDKLSGKLMFINKVSAAAAGPCHITVNDKHILTANYSGGSLCVFKRNENGSVSELIQIIQHTGSSFNKTRQATPHVHQSAFTPDNKFVVTNDLGTDYVNVYKYNPNVEKDVLISFDSLLVKPGSGPRHLTFSRSGEIAYLLQELDGTLSVINNSKGKLNLIQETTVIRQNEIVNGAADIHLSPDEKFVYATNRGSVNNITCFKVLKNNKLVFVQQISTMGIGPRNFSITKDGKYLLVGNQKSNEIVVFKRNIGTGKLKDTKIRINIGAPVCLIEF
jgi:6-phosphogluconolactonase